MVDIRQIPMGGRIDDFLNVVDYIYRDDPAYVRPLDMELKDRLNPKKNPFFEHGEGAIFCAYRNGCVRRALHRDHRPRAPRALRRRRRVLRLPRHRRRRGGRARAPRPGRELAPRQGDEARARAALAQHQRGDRLPRRRLRHAAVHHDAAPPALPGRAHREGRLREGEGLLRLAATRSASSTRA